MPERVVPDMGEVRGVGVGPETGGTIMQRTNRHRGRLPKRLMALASLFVVGAGLLAAAPAATAVPVPASKYRAYVFTYNMCGGDRGTGACPEAPGNGVVEEIRDRVKTYQPVAFALQEACHWQVVKLVAVLNADPTLKAKGLTYTADFLNAGSGMPVPSQCWGRRVPEAGTFAGPGWGNAVVHVGPRVNVASRTLVEGTYSAQLWVVPRLVTKIQKRNYVCSLVQPYNLWMCSTHLDLDGTVRAKQIAELAKVTAGIRGRHVPPYPIVVGGDFNGGPKEMGSMLAGSYGGTGIFSEAAVPSGCLSFASICAIAPANLTEGGSKLDYLFTSPQVRVLDTYTLSAKSDHRILVNRIAFG
jgi:hypothetical protein